jgi:CSLREA domain-containing protein
VLTRTLAGSVALSLLALSPAIAGAATIRPNTSSDELDPVPDGRCSLREAISSANADEAIGGCRAGAGADTIVLRPGATYGRSLSGADDANARGDLDIHGEVAIRVRHGRGAILQGTSGPEGDRVLEIGAGARVTITGVMVRNGNSTSAGGGILNEGALAIRASTLYRNLAGNDGGGIANDGDLALVGVTLSGNRAGAGGGLSVSGGAAHLRSSTVTRNRAEDGGGIARSAGTLCARASIIAANLDLGGAQAPDCSGATASAGHNLIGSAAGCALVRGRGDRVGARPRLGRLTDNGGATLTHPLHAGSAAVNRGGKCPRADQRGAPRRLGGRCDIGAYERVRCAGALVNFVGTPGRDSILGTLERDGILGLGGRDHLRGFGGSDGVCGGPGADRLAGGGGADRLAGGPGRDRVGGGPGRDTALGSGGDRISGCERVHR